jgi:two-component sensor histidine kinase
MIDRFVSNGSEKEGQRFLTQSRQLAALQGELSPITDRALEFAGLCDSVNALRRQFDVLSRALSDGFAAARHDTELLSRTVQRIERESQANSSGLTQSAREFAAFATRSYESELDLQERVQALEEAQRRLATDVNSLGGFASEKIHERLPAPVVSPRPDFQSGILGAFPSIFDEFSDKRFELLYRGS